VVSLNNLEIIKTAALDREAISQTLDVLRRTELDFMLHHPIPDNHLFEFEHNGNPNPDFMTRLEAHKEWGTPLPPDASWEMASQFVAILPPGLGLGPLEHLRKQLPDLSIIRATSPFDHASTWVEIFPAGVSKATTGRWLCEFLGVPLDKTMAIGNDYNDLDLLEMSPHPYVVANAPDELTGRFTTVADNDHDGVAMALGTWTRTVLAG
jgi:hydroxymethylpyrimidine pyrophosphatase-like HAD family hydrolase